MKKNNKETMRESKRIRILHIAQAAGGVERYLQMLLKYMNQNKFENILLCSQDYNLEKFKANAERCIQIDMYREVGIHDLNTILKVRKIIKECKPDIIYAHSSKAGAIARLANICIKSKCVYNPHGWAFNMDCSNRKKALYRIIEKLLSGCCEKIICISDAEKNSALKYGICKASKLHIIYNGIEISKVQKENNIIRAHYGIPENAFVVGMVGRVSRQKAPDIFIRAAELIKKEIPSAFFVIVGAGEMESEIQKYADNCDLSKSLLITGWVDNPDAYIECFDVATLLSRWEGFGLVLAEYMLAEKPIIATNVDAIPNLIRDEYNGLLVDMDDYQAVAQKVISIYNDEELVKYLSKNAAQVVREEFDVKRVAKAYEDLSEKMYNQ